MNRRVAGCFAIVLCVAALVVVSDSCGAEERPTERVSPAPEVNSSAVVWRTPAPPVSPQAGDVWVDPRNGMEMVYIAPGDFTLGTSDAQIDAWLKEHPNGGRKDFKDEQPQCRVNLPGYWIGRTEVTNAQYVRFVAATGHPAPDHWTGGRIPSGLENFPVVCVEWEDARAYCEWAARHLPTELEWEKAARGTDGRIFPWGNQWESKRCRNFELISGKKYATLYDEVLQWMKSHDFRREGAATVGSYGIGASPYGCLDMAGNAWEWCGDWYNDKAYERYAKGDLTAPTSGQYRVLRGGSWLLVHPGYFRCSGRYGTIPGGRSNYFDLFFYGGVGFRCARLPT